MIMKTDVMIGRRPLPIKTQLKGQVAPFLTVLVFVLDVVKKGREWTANVLQTGGDSWSFGALSDCGLMKK